ncbi:helix-turn-helix domain-containing protein [Streptomyces sp. NPDC059783]|uniref:helix-turn-helix domain-containing protein n=1 Tax=Streptomyces sp. NPDC059783 TaxID=3346944 RepID=UPI0036590037
MDSQQVIAPPRAQQGPPGPQPPHVSPTSGVIHVNARHTTGFTVIGNHLAQHRELSLLAIGLAAHIQSLPAGAQVGIKSLAARFPEGEARIAEALRELEGKGYLHRSRVRLPDGRVVTRTVSYNRPRTTGPMATALRPRSRSLPCPRPEAQQGPHPEPQPERPLAPSPEPQPQPEPEPQPNPQPRPAAPPTVHVPAPTAPRRQPRPLPQPLTPTPELYRTATAVLADLRRHAPQLSLTEREIEELAPGVAAWLERDGHPDAIRRALTSDLPVPVAYPSKFVRSRITALLPPPLPGSADLAPPPHRRVLVIPLQNCDGCDRAFRAREPGLCRACRTHSSPDPHATAA